MERLSISEVSKRRRSLENKKRKKDLSFLLNKEKLTLKEVQEIIDNFESINEDQIYSFEYMMNIFRESCYNGTCKNDLDVKRLAKSICHVMPRLETADNPVKDIILKQSRESRNFAKRTMRNAKEFAKRAMDPEEGSIPSKDYQNHKKELDEFPDGYQVKTLSSKPTKDSFSVSTTPAAPTSEAVSEAYDMILNTAKKISIYDRVLYNHNRLSKRFNIEDVVESSKDFEFCVYELCELIDSYDLPFEIKYNVALENILYLFDINKKFNNENPKYYIDEYQYTKDLSPQDVIFMESITKENPFYYEESSKVNLTVNEFTSILEANKENPINKLIDDFKKDNNKSVPKIKDIIKKFYTKSPEQVIDGTPNFLSWIRNVAVLSLFPLNPILGCVAFFTDQMIALHLKRAEMEKVLKKYKSEMDKVEKKIDKTNSKEKKEKLTKYHDQLKKDYDKLKEYRDSLRTEKELDDEWEINENCLAEGMFEKISMGDELKEIRYKIIFEFKRVLERLKIASTNKFKYYFDNGYFTFVPDEDIEEFISYFDTNLGKYLDAEGNICMNFCCCNFEKLFEKDDQDYFKIIEELCEFCNIGNRREVSVSYEGTGGKMYLIFTYLEPLYIEADMREEVREFYFHPMTYHSLGTIIEVSNIFETLVDYPKEKFIDNLLELDFSTQDVKEIIDYFRETSIFDIDESVDILSRIRDNSEENSYGVKSLINSFIKESSNIPEKDFDLYSFREDVEEYIILSEGVADKVKKKSKELAAKAGVKKDNAKEKIKDKSARAANTAKLGLQVGKRSAKKLDAKQQRLSKQLDDSVASLGKRLQDAAVSQSREQIIRGSILPSASKIIKLAMGLGGAYVVNPAIAVIGALSFLFMSKNATKRERALILDEIDIELKIVEKKIQKAESEDDTDTLRDLYKIQNKLRREKQRLRYRMNVYYRQIPISSNPKGDD